MNENDITIPSRVIKSKNKTGQIYIIKNYINNMVYIGETTVGYKNRFASHCKFSNRIKKSNYKLYKAMNYLGIDKFYVELLEDNVPIEKMYEREIYFIKKYDSFNNGYNSTKGGDGRYINNINDIKSILESYKNGESTNSIAKRYGVNAATIVRTCHRYNISTRSGGNKYSTIDKSVFIKLWNEGITIKKMAEYFSLNEKSIRRYVKRFGLKPRHNFYK